MTDQQLDDDLTTLLNDLDDVGAKFADNAAKNRRTRINAEPTRRQDTYGDQPEREFDPEVFLLVPHNNVTPGTATFTKSVFEVERDEVASVVVALSDTTVATVVVGEPAFNWVVSMEVVDGNGDGQVTVEVDVPKAGQSKNPVGAVFSAAAAGDRLRNLTRRQVPDNPIDEGPYPLEASVRGRRTDVGELIVQAPSPATADREASSTTDRTASSTTDRTASSTATAASESPSTLDDEADSGREATAGADASADTDAATDADATASQSAGEPRQRPLPRRPAADPPLRSSGVTVRYRGGRTEYVDAGNRYEAEVLVENAGGLGGEAIEVELFAEHRPPTATVDTNAGGVLEGRGRKEFRVTGSTSLPPGHKLVGVAYTGSTLRHDTILWRSTRGHAQVDAIGETVTDDRTFEIVPYLGNPNANGFRFRVYWATGIDLTKDRYYPDTTQARKNFVGVLGNEAVELADVGGTLVSGQPSNAKEPLALASTIQDASLIRGGQRTVTVPSGDATATTFDWTAPPSRGDRVLTVLYARTYSRAPQDMPADWDALDHTTSRFVGRSELYWRNATPS